MKNIKKMIFVTSLIFLLSSCGMPPGTMPYESPAYSPEYSDSYTEDSSFLNSEEDIEESSQESMSNAEIEALEKQKYKEEIYASEISRMMDELIMHGDWDNTPYVWQTDNGSVIKVIFWPDFEQTKSPQELEDIFMELIPYIMKAYVCDSFEGDIWGEYIAEASYDSMTPGINLVSYYEVYTCEAHPNCFPAG